jgi:two-component sensor histidine kinase
MKASSQKQMNQQIDLSGFSQENLRLLLDTIEGINHTKEFKSVLIESLEAIRIVMNSEASSLMLLDEDSEELYVRISTGPVKEEIIGKSIPKDQGIAGWVFRNRTPYITNDLSKSEEFFGELASDFTTRNLICLPLINRDDEAIGVVQAVNRKDDAEFTTQDVPVFDALATHVTSAIERTRYVDYLQLRLKEKDVLVAEMNHRIKNNLLALNTLISIELKDLGDNHGYEVLKSMHSRVNSMYELHEMLMEKNLGQKVELDHYLKQISEKIHDSMSYIFNEATIEFQGDSVQVSQEQALRCGLILNELLLNIYKHAFRKDDEKGEINIRLEDSGKTVKLHVSDNGVGLPEEFKSGKDDSVGMWIVEELADKMNADIEIESESGTRFTITFPLK